MSERPGDVRRGSAGPTSRASLIKFAADGIARGVAPIVLFPLITRYAGADAFGAYSLALTVNSLVLPFATAGITGAVMRFFAGGDLTAARARAVSTSLKVVALMSASTALLVALAAPLSSRVFLRGESTPVFAWAAALIFATAMEQVVLEVLRARYRLLPSAAYELVQAATLLLVAAEILRAGFGVVGLIQAAVLLKVIALFVVYVITLRPLLGRGSSREVGSPAVVSLVKFGIPLSVASLGLWAVNLGDRLLVGRYLGAFEAARYGAAFLAASVLWIFSAAINLPASPRIVGSVVAQDASGLATDLRRFHHLLVVILVPVAALVVLVGDVALNTAAGGRFAVGTIVLALVTAGLFLDQWNGLAHYVLTGLGETRYLRNAWLASGAINLAFTSLLVPRFGIVGAATGGFAAMTALEVAIFIKASRPAGLITAYQWRATAIATIVAAASARVAAIPLNRVRGGMPAIAASGVTFAFLYVAGMLVAREIGLDELRLLTSAFRPATGDRR